MPDFDLYRRQYVLGPRPAGIPGWRAMPLGNRMVLNVQPELACTEMREGHRELICLGDMFSPEQPQAANQTVLEALFDKFLDFESIEQATAPLGGRWVLFARLGTEMRAYPDATGSRPVYYCPTKEGIWLGSLPKVLADILGLAVDTQANGELARYPRSDWWPGELTPFREIKHSPPNYYLDLLSGTPTRFWPRHPVPPIDVETGAAGIKRLLLGIITAANHRYELHLAVTGGYDTRVLLAVSRPLHGKIRFFTLDYPGISPYDLTTSQRLAKRCVFPYTREPYDVPPEAFLRRFDELTSRMVTGQSRLNAFSYQRFPPRAAFIEGTVSEVLRCFYHKNECDPVEVSAAELAKRAGFSGSPIAEAEFRRWLEGVPGGMNVSAWDLFYWEQRMGNWIATDYAAQELTRFVFTPFNCRQLLELGLGTPAYARREPYLLHRTVCQLAFPEVLEERFNFALATEWQRLQKRLIGKAKRMFGG